MTLGEALVVLDPVAKGPLRHVDTFVRRLGGAELNVAVGLARLGHESGWAGRLGEDELGHAVLAFLRAEGVDVSGAHLDPGAPTGLYFKERPTLDRLRVAYYRTGSAASRTSWEDLDLELLLGAEVLHLTGITPALSESCADLVARLAAAARERGTLLSVDANLRWALLGDRDPRALLAPLVEAADLLFLSEEEAAALLGSATPEGIGAAREGLRAEVVVVHGASGAWAAQAGGIVSAPAHAVAVVDTVGAGDAFVAGFLSARLRGWDTEACLRLGNACGACAVSVPGDAESMPYAADALALLGDAGPAAPER